MKPYSALLPIQFTWICLLTRILSFATDPPVPVLIFNSSGINQSNFYDKFNIIDCPPLAPVENGKAVVKNYFDGHCEIVVTCNENFSLIGESVIFAECVNKEWKYSYLKGDFPKCQLRCSPPPYLENGKLTIEKKMGDINIPVAGYLDGTTVTYTCDDGYALDSQSTPVRVCQKGKWMGTDAFCQRISEVTCAQPPDIANGFSEPTFSLDYSRVAMGQEVLYQCLPGYRMVGTDRLKCTIDGTWSDELPTCIEETEFFPSRKCVSEPLLDSKLHFKAIVTSVINNVAEVDCHPDYQNKLSPCKPTKFYCTKGKWFGVYPHCVKAYECKVPPDVHYSLAINRNFETSYDSEGNPYYPINAQIKYECLKGYELEGSSIISCRQNGCWEPVDIWPTCVRTNQDYFVELNNINAIFISTATGAGVLGILLLACLVVACKKRRALARAVPLPPPNGGNRHASDVVNDHTILLQNPDRLALIAFADGVQNNQNNTLPSYDEATRDRSTLIQVSRLQIQRPHWPNLAVCRTSRNRSSPNIDHVTRHGSFASHTPSMRSGGESMGSTETVTISEGSTNVTLDTASSHSAVSQNASCRGHCGSLASFDGCSMANTEGIPLLEENELEEAQGTSNSGGEDSVVADGAKTPGPLNSH